MGLGVLFDVPEREELLEGLTLPAIFRNHIPNGAMNLKLKAYEMKSYVVPLAWMPNNLIRLQGKMWRSLIRSNKYPNITKMFFSWIKENKFNVTFINSEGIEKRKYDDEPEYVHSYRMEATDETWVKQDLPKELLKDFNNRETTQRNREGRVNGPRQSNTVDVYYIFDVNKSVGEAKGFHGKTWTLFCYENEIEAGQTLMFVNERDMEFTVNVFTADGIQLQMDPLNKELNTDDPHTYHEDSDHEEHHKVLKLNHKCHIIDHHHQSGLEVFYKKIESITVQQNILTIPREFVRFFQLPDYKTARLKYGTMPFEVKLKVHPDPRRPGNETHMVMETDWSKLLKRAGLTEGKVLRFQLNVQDCLKGNFLEFDIC